MLRALPLSCFFAMRARSFWPWGLVRTKSVAASEKAHLRWTLPNLATAGYGLQQIQGVGFVVLGGCQDKKFEVVESLIIIGDAGEIDLDGLWD
jgi:hypothetical protein